MMFKYIIGTKNNSLNYVQKIILDLQMLNNTHKSIKRYNTILKQEIHKIKHYNSVFITYEYIKFSL